MSKFLNFIINKRLIIGILIIILFTILKISGSSINEWNTFFNDGENYNGVLLGESRSIRSDEWAVFTPMALSQTKSDFSYFNDIVRGTSTDMYIEYGQPVLDYSIIFRPFQIGYLFLGAEMGLAFFWCSRFIILFLISFEFCLKIITRQGSNLHRNYLFSFLYACSLSLSSFIQWWFSINGLVEMLFFAQLALILFNQYFQEKSKLKKFFFSICISWCACGFILTFYPPWQVPTGYILLLFIIYIFINNFKNYKFNKYDLINIFIFIIFLGCSLGYIFYRSWDTILSILNTVYPGNRETTGGGILYNFFYYTANLFTPFDTNVPGSNVCEIASVFTLFPLNILFCIFILIYQHKTKKKKDLLLILLLIFTIFLSVYCILGFPATLSKLTLLSLSQSGRTVAIIGILNLIILLRSIFIAKELSINLFKPIYTISYILCAEVIVFFSNEALPEYLTKQRLLLINLFIFLILFAIYLYLNKHHSIFISLIFLSIGIICGCTVNPIQHGLDAIYEHSIIKEIEKLNTEDPGKWIVAECSFPINNIPIMAGAPCINSTNVYPNLKLWSSLDQDNKYEDIYNRYAHINIKFTKKKDTSFELLQADSFSVNLSLKDLNKINPQYILTQSNLSKFNLEKYNYKIVYAKNNYYIYKKFTN